MQQAVKMPAPRLNAENQAYFDAAGRGVLLVKRCTTCGEAHHYPRVICPFCFSAETEWQEASGAGTLHAYTVMRREQPSTITAYVELAEGPLMLTNLVDCDPQLLRIGIPVKVGFADAEDGVRVPVFTPS